MLSSCFPISYLPLVLVEGYLMKQSFTLYPDYYWITGLSDSVQEEIERVMSNLRLEDEPEEMINCLCICPLWWTAGRPALLQTETRAEKVCI